MAPSCKNSQRRPLRFWQPFNDWWRSELERQSRRPSSGAIARWYEDNAPMIWGSELPTLEETRTHARCLRSVTAVRDYFRSYRAGKRQEGHAYGLSNCSSGELESGDLDAVIEEKTCIRGNYQPASYFHSNYVSRATAVAPPSLCFESVLGSIFDESDIAQPTYQNKDNLSHNYTQQYVDQSYPCLRPVQVNIPPPSLPPPRTNQAVALNPYGHAHSSYDLDYLDGQDLLGQIVVKTEPEAIAENDASASTSYRQVDTPDSENVDPWYENYTSSPWKYSSQWQQHPTTPPSVDYTVIFDLLQGQHRRTPCETQSTKRKCCPSDGTTSQPAAKRQLIW